MLNVAESPKSSKASRVIRDIKDLSPMEQMLEARKWVADVVMRSRLQPWTFRDRLTPARARALLEVNPDNRRLSDVVVDKYARDISNDAWAENGQTIVIAKDGHLNDGQHRCHAVVRADREIVVAFVVGVDRESRFTIDQGKSRMAGDFLGMMGHKDPLALSAAAGYIWQHQQHGQISTQSAHRPTKGEVLAIVEKHPDISLSLEAIPNKGSDGVGGRSMIAFVRWTFAQVAGDTAADEFVTALVSGAGLSLRDPILYARNRLMAERGRLKPNEKAELLIRAWNAHRRRETPKTLAILNGALPKVER